MSIRELPGYVHKSPPADGDAWMAVSIFAVSERQSRSVGFADYTNFVIVCKRQSRLPFGQTIAPTYDNINEKFFILF